MFTALWAQVLFARPVSAAFTFTLIGMQNCLHWRNHTWVFDIKGLVGVNPDVRHIGANSSVAPGAHEYMKTLQRLRAFSSIQRENIEKLKRLCDLSFA